MLSFIKTEITKEFRNQVIENDNLPLPLVQVTIYCRVLFHENSPGRNQCSFLHGIREDFDGKITKRTEGQEK